MYQSAIANMCPHHFKGFFFHDVEVSEKYTWASDSNLPLKPASAYSIKDPLLFCS
jgi:hypothetical protein